MSRHNHRRCWKGRLTVTPSHSNWYVNSAAQQSYSSNLRTKSVHRRFENIGKMSSLSHQPSEIQHYFMNPIDIQDETGADTQNSSKEKSEPLSSNFHQGQNMYPMISNTEANPIQPVLHPQISLSRRTNIRNIHAPYENTPLSPGNQAPPHIAFPEDPFQRHYSCLICNDTGRPLLSCRKCLGGKLEWRACTHCRGMGENTVGTGLLPFTGNARIPCWSCNGKRGFSSNCEICDGNGKLLNHFRYCTCPIGLRMRQYTMQQKE